MEEPTKGLGNMVACGVFVDRLAAERVVVDLLNAGLDGNQMIVSMREPEEARKMAMEKGIKAGTEGLVTPPAVPEDKARAYQERVEKGGVLLAVSCGDQCDSVMGIMTKDGAEMGVCVPTAEGVPPRHFHDPDQAAEMEHMHQPWEPPDQPGQFRPEFRRDDQGS